VPDTVGVDEAVLDWLTLGDGLPDDEDEPLGDGLPDEDGFGVPAAVGVQLGVDGPVEPPVPWLPWPAGVVPPLVALE
jgi:hypothetical protein